MLDGAAHSLSRLVALELELALEPLYVGQPRWLELVEQVATRGFGLVSVEPNTIDPGTGHLLEINGLFLRRSEDAE